MTEGGGRRWGRLGLKDKWQREQRRALELLEFSGNGTLFRVKKDALPPPDAPAYPGTVEVEPVEAAVFDFGTLGGSDGDTGADEAVGDDTGPGETDHDDADMDPPDGAETGDGDPENG